MRGRHLINESQYDRDWATYLPPENRAAYRTVYQRRGPLPPPPPNAQPFGRALTTPARQRRRWPEALLPLGLLLLAGWLAMIQAAQMVLAAGRWLGGMLR